MLKSSLKIGRFFAHEDQERSYYVSSVMSIQFLFCGSARIYGTAPGTTGLISVMRSHPIQIKEMFSSQNWRNCRDSMRYKKKKTCWTYLCQKQCWIFSTFKTSNGDLKLSDILRSYIHDTYFATAKTSMRLVPDKT